MSITQPRKMINSAADLVSTVRISEVYRALTGKDPRRTGAETFRAPALWRGGAAPSVSLRDGRNVWHDFVTDEKGGLLALVQRVRGGTRLDALRWVADLAGVPLTDKVISPEVRVEWAKERRELEQQLPDAGYWRDAALNMAQDLLTHLKAQLFDPLPIPDDLSEPAPLTR